MNDGGGADRAPRTWRQRHQNDRVADLVPGIGSGYTGDRFKSRKRLLGPREPRTNGSGVLMQFKDYYKIMGVPEDASADDVKKAYRALARKHHPDLNKDARFRRKVQGAGRSLRGPEGSGQARGIRSTAQIRGVGRPGVQTASGLAVGFRFRRRRIHHGRYRRIQRLLRKPVRPARGAKSPRGAGRRLVRPARRGRQLPDSGNAGGILRRFDPRAFRCEPTNSTTKGT